MTSVFLALMIVASAFASDPALDRLKHASEQAQILTTDRGRNDGGEQRMAAVHVALLSWIESRLPHGETVTPGSLAILGDKLNEELKEAGLTAKAEAPDDDPLAEVEWPGYGFPSVEFEWRPELPNSAFLTAMVSVPCGAESRVFMYDVRGPRWVRVLSDIPRGRYLNAGDFEFSTPDRDGNRLLLIRYGTSQCASMWMGLSYSVYRINVDGDRAERLVSDDSGYYGGYDRGPLFLLNSNELLVEFDAYSVDIDILIRTHLRRYRFDSPVTRVDPIALQPQDFAEEWLTRPWSEMASRSAEGLEKKHTKLDGFGRYAGVIPCAAFPNRWLIDIETQKLNGDEIEPTGEVFLLVSDLGGYQYKMEAVSEDRPEGCPGEGIKSGFGFASDKHPWLSREELLRFP